MHILFVTPNWPPAPCGLGDYTWNLSRALVEQGHCVSILTRYSKLIDRLAGVEVHADVRSWRSPGLFATLPVLKKKSPDVIHLQYEGYGFNQSFFLPALWKLASPRKVLTLHEVWFKNRVHRWRDSFLHRASNHVIVNDQGGLERYQLLGTGVPVSKIGVGANIPLKIENSLSTDSPIRIGYFGFFNRIKHVDLLMQAVADLIRSGQALELLLVGEFRPDKSLEHRELASLRDKLGLEKQIRFTGLVEALEAARLLRTCTFAVLPFIDGASPRRGSLQACLGLGLPTITTRSAYAETDLRDGETVLYLETLSKSDLSRAIVRLAGDPALRHKLSQGALAFAEKYSWSRIASRHIEIYEQQTRDKMGFGPKTSR
jgi:glycosyltransferase involved in cell wall biosynthesis